VVGYPTNSSEVYNLEKKCLLVFYKLRVQSNLQMIEESEEEEEKAPKEVLDAPDPRKSGRVSLYLFANGKKTASKFP
jgi:hypothetical protein